MATLTLGSLRAADPAGLPTFTASDYTSRVEPALKQYCLGCHSIEKHKGDLDLESVNRWADVQKHPKIWQGVAEQIANGEMPPKDKPQPSPAEREALLAAVNAMLDEVARSRAGDPGPVVLRRLSNAEYTYTIRDLTGVPSLDPAREFPVDGAAGEGFMNTGNALVMSPALVTKYLDAGKDIASHAVLLPDGIRFSAKSTRRDWTEEILGDIRTFYRGFTDPKGGDTVNLQGIVFQTNEGGRLPLEKYLQATLELRGDPGSAGVSATDAAAIRAVADRHGLSAKYLATLYSVLQSREPSALLDPLRASWKTATTPAAIAGLAADIGRWQKALWRFTSVGHIGKAGGPSAWMEPVVPLVAKQEFRLKLSAPTNGAADRAVYLVAGDAGDGSAHDVVLWKQPRLVAPGRPEIPLRDLAAVSTELDRRRTRIFSGADKALAAAAEAAVSEKGFDPAVLARKHGVEPAVLVAWLDGLGLQTNTAVRIESLFTRRVENVSGFDFVQGWGNPETPNVFANRSDKAVRIPGNLKAHGVVVHPSPTLQAAVGWKSPISGTLRVEARITHAHPECGNGVTWVLELQHGSMRQRLGAGTSQGGKEVKSAPVDSITVRPGDLVSLRVGPRDGNHSCDLTSVELVLRETREGGREWNLTREVSGDGIAANPHADALGNPGVWVFYTEPDKGGAEADPVAPAGSLLARWRSETDPKSRTKHAAELRALLTGKTIAAPGSPDAQLLRQLSNPSGPLLRGTLAGVVKEIAAAKPSRSSRSAKSGAAGSVPILSARDFGHLPGGAAIDPLDLAVQAPSVMEVRIPASLAAGYELVTTGTLAPGEGAEGSVQLRLVEGSDSPGSRAVPAGLTGGLVAGDARVIAAAGPWTTSAREVASDNPVLVTDGSAARKRMEAAMSQFRDLFPAALCYTKIVPVDEVVTLTLFYREDHHLARLMLDDAQRATLDRLWSELHFVSQDALTLVDAFEQLWQFATQDADPKVFEPLREPIQRRAAEFRKTLEETKPRHVDAVIEFAERAYRRPLKESERADLKSLVAALRKEDLSHEDSIRLALARVLVSPAFLYRAEAPVVGKDSGPVGSWELANRLSYFLWSSAPDAELKKLAANGTLTQPDVLAAQARRMLKAPQVRRLATEFGCAWLHVYAFDQSSEKSERHFPTFTALKGAMYEETIQFLTDLFQSDRPVSNLIDADYTFLNGPLAAHYGIPGVTGDAWRKVDGVRAQSRGGILAQASTLSTQSGASRTSPILRGNWLTEVILGDKLPKPPKDVPRLPEDEATETLTVRQLTEKHSTDPRCAGCHRRIDAFGFSMESFDAIGRKRDLDLGGRKIDTRVKVLDGAEFEGLDGLRDYLLHRRGDAFLRQFCRKLLGYALGRSVQLSDGPLIQSMRESLKQNDYRVGAAVEVLVRSRQFREIRGADHAPED